MLLLSAVGLVVPAVFHRLARGTAAAELKLDTEIAVVLLVTYVLSLVFTLRTHRNLYGTPATARATAAATARAEASAPCHSPRGDRGGGVGQRAAGRRGRGTAREFGMTKLFVGVVIVALVGNAAEHFSAMVMAANNKMDAAIAIAVGSSTQIALFVAPVLVFLSYVIAPQPMDLRFTTFELVAIGAVGAEHLVHRARRRDELDGRRAAARGLHRSWRWAFLSSRMTGGSPADSPFIRA